MAQDVPCPSKSVLVPGFCPLTKWLQVLDKKLDTCFGAKLLGGRRRTFVGAIAVFTNEEISSPEECLTRLFEVEVLFFVFFVIIVDVFENPAILEDRRRGGFLVILAEDATFALRDIQEIRFVVAEIRQGLLDELHLIAFALLFPEVIDLVFLKCLGKGQLLIVEKEWRNGHDSSFIVESRLILESSEV